MLSAALVAAAWMAPETAMAAALEQRICSNGTSQARCSVRLDQNGLEVRLHTNQTLNARRLGHWRISQQDGITTQSCNARIDLGDEVVYGVLRINSSTGTSLIWPQQRIDIHNLHFNSNSPGESESHLDTSSAQPGHPSAAD